MRRGLAPVIEGCRVLRTEARRPDLRRPLPEGFAARLTGARVTHVGRRAKYLLVGLDRDETLLIHLGMSGRMLISGAMPGGFHHPHRAAERHDHVVFEIEGGARVTFNDARRFGMMDLWPTAALETHPALAALGPEPLGNSFHAGHLRARFAGRRAPIKAALLDQRVVAGLGNIYVAEALHRAGISPHRAAGRIAAARLETLAEAIRAVLEEAIAAGGASLRDHRRTNGDAGHFQHSFRVYGRAGHPCARPGCTGTIRRAVQAGRSSYWCPVCQR